MESFILLAKPWWVNLGIFIPIGLYFWFRKGKLKLDKRDLIIAAIFGVAFGFVEAAVVIYLRAALGLLPGYLGSLADVARQSLGMYEQSEILSKLPSSLSTVELFREAATMVMLAVVAFLLGKKAKDRAAVFLWTFAFWDIFYYFWLRLTVGWPSALTTSDVLFLIPVPWFSQVWFPLLVSGSTIAVIWFSARRSG